MIEDAVLEKYLSNQLTPEERTSFEVELDTNENLKLRLKILKSQKSYLKNQEAITRSRSAISDVSQEFRKQFQAPEVKKTSKIIYLIPSAIAAMLIVGLFIRPLITATDTSSSALFADYFHPTQLSLLTKNDSNNELLQNAQITFNQENYTEAIGHLTELIDREPANEQFRFNLAVAELGAGQSNQAITKLEQFYEHPLYGSAALWYAALSYLKLENIVNAKTSLNAIPTDSSYFEAAQQLLKKLN